MTKGKNQHVVRAGSDWGVRGAGNSRLTVVTDTQTDAYNIARDIARNQHSEVFIHGKNGQIRARESFGNDPASIKDTEH